MHIYYMYVVFVALYMTFNTEPSSKSSHDDYQLWIQLKSLGSLIFFFAEHLKVL